MPSPRYRLRRSRDTTAQGVARAHLDQNHIPGSVSRSTLGVALRIVLAVAAIGFVATQVDMSAIVETGKKADKWWILLAVLLLPINISLEAVTWYPLLRRVAGPTSRIEAFLAVVSGYPLGMFTPARVGELAGRALFIREGDRTTIAISAAVARLADLVVVLAAGTAMLVAGRLTGYVHFDGAIALVGVALVATVVSTSVVLAPGTIARIADRFHFMKRYRPKIAFLTDLPVGVMVRVIGFSAVRLSVYSGQFVVLAFGFSQGLNPG
ncbi:MAG: flippase-like domain-containing protein, partial [Rhodothermales bacterium]|nr:flippase-like domain-containing protein [Rhodothermales bacterium]